MKDTWDKLKIIAMILGAGAVAGLSARGAYEFVFETGPQVQRANTSELRGHHDTLMAVHEDLDGIEERLLHHDSVDAYIVGTMQALDRGQSYLICDRQRRRAELEGETFSRDCEAEQLLGEGR